MAAVCAAAPLALANQLPLPRLYSALVWSSRKLRYIRIRPLMGRYINVTPENTHMHGKTSQDLQIIKIDPLVQLMYDQNMTKKETLQWKTGCSLRPPMSSGKIKFCTESSL